MVLHRGLPGARVTEGGGPGVVVDKVANALPCVADLPTFRQGILILQPAKDTHAHTSTQKSLCIVGGAQNEPIDIRA